MKKNIKSVLLIALLCLSASPLKAEHFQRGSQNISVLLGSASSFNDNYIVLGAGYGYYLLNGLEIGIDAQFWLSGDPSITKLSPKINYVFYQPRVVKPYVGAFFRRSYISGLPDLDSVGYRAGLLFRGSDNFYFGGGVVYEDFQDCNETVYRDCTSSYPEILFSIAL